MELINRKFGKDIGGLIWAYGRPRTIKEIEVDIEKIRCKHMCPECKKVIDNKDPDFYVETINYACCWNFCWQDYDEDLAYEYAFESYEKLYPPPPPPLRNIRIYRKKQK